MDGARPWGRIGATSRSMQSLSAAVSPLRAREETAFSISFSL